MSTKKYKTLSSFLWEVIKPYKYHYLSFAIIAPVFTGIANVIFFFFAGQFVDTLAQDNTTYQDLSYLLMLFLGYPIVLNITWRIANIAEWRAEPYVRRSILVKSYDYVQYHSFNFFQNRLSGSLLSKIRGLLNGYDILFGTFTDQIFQWSTVLIIGSAILFTIDYTLGLFVIIWMMVFFVVFFFMGKKASQLSFADSESTHRVIGGISDRITNMISIFHFASKKRETKALYQHITDDFIVNQVKLYKYDFIFQIVQWCFYFAMWSGFIFILIKARLNGSITLGDIAFAFGLISIVSDSVWILSHQMQEFTKNLGNLKSSFEILKIPHDNKDIKGAKDLIIKKPSIEFKNVEFNYDESEKVFNNLNLKIKPGENVGIVGYSGAGKSSLVNILLRYFEIQGGKVLIDNQDTSLALSDSIRSNISLIPQDIMLFHRTLMENIRYGKPDASDDEVMKASKQAHIDEFIKTLPEGYNTLVGERGIKLSGGQRQRIAIARAILKNAPILILDEATSSLDLKTEKYIQDSINHILDEENTTVIAIAHRLSTIQHMDRIIVLDQGKIIEEGTHDELINKENSFYKNLHFL